MTIAPKKVNYLNNKDILKEIHESKNTYCYYEKPEYHRYDLIVNMPQEDITKSFEYIITPEILQQAKEVRAIRLSQDTEKEISADEIKTTDLVFRIMTWEHIPVSHKPQKKTANKKSAKEIFSFESEEIDEIFADLEDPSTKNDVDDMVHVKVNFPPFQHYKIDENNTFRCVGKSHWTGDLENGEFSKDHGTITNKLAKIYIMMCEKYAMRYNWRSYTYRDEMQNSAILQLTYVGLRFNEAKSSNPFAYYTQTITNSFCRILNSEKRNQNIRDDILELNGLQPSWTRQGMTSTTSYEE